MKYSECNARQKKAFRNIKYAACWIIGGLENTLLDYAEDSDAYKSAKETLANHEELVDEIYRAATTELFDEGFCCFNADAASYLKDIRFCGKAWLMERCDKRVTKCGY